MKFDLSKRYCYYFNEIAKIPHGSRNEKALSDYVVSIAKANGYPVRQDAVWNVIVDMPAASGCENADPVILQAHMDMVTDQVSGGMHNFENDPLELYVEDGWLKAKGTTLGADDGMGVAYMLALMEEKDLPHPKLQLIFTTMEEIGLLGAQHLKKEDIHAKRMISLDGSFENVTTVTSAGGMNVILHKEVKPVPAAGHAYRFAVRGLSGGHSAHAISMERYNANNLAARILKEAGGIFLVFWNGGLKDNAITRNAELIICSKMSYEELHPVICQIEKTIARELEHSDPGFYVELEEIGKQDTMIDMETSQKILTYLWLMPHGFQHKHMAIEGLTAASLNLGVLHIENGRMDGLILMRSCFASMLDDMYQKLYELGGLLDIQVSKGDHYNGWAYEKDSVMRDIYADVLERQHQKLITKASHGGLECGIFKGLEPEMDIITMGAVCEDIHTYDERLDLKSYERTWQLLKDIIVECTKR